MLSSFPRNETEGSSEQPLGSGASLTQGESEIPVIIDSRIDSLIPSQSGFSSISEGTMVIEDLSASELPKGLSKQLCSRIWMEPVSMANFMGETDIMEATLDFLIDQSSRSGRFIPVMDHLLEGLCERLSLKEMEEDGLLLEESLVEEMIARGKKCLIFKLLTVKHFNKEALKSTMKKVWSASRLISIRDLSPNLFIVEFGDERGKEKVKREGPWSFDRHLVITKDVVGLQQVHQVAMKEALFWVKIHDLPAMVRNANVSKTVGNALIRVCLEISKPLPRGKKVCVGSSLPIGSDFDTKGCPPFVNHVNSWP
ncbi:unnamed protein product [Fraxinus pennsylvanica]|uniref:DUF4283 domain-containing protein n=1 Tax=Fraxinus pennsylvanica TaxID=56036 RepID=A0AAD2AFH8_9LAMI|nr:unnamed protein product [Fraxinus pennsylvanica]